MRPASTSEPVSCETCLACCCRLEVHLARADRVPGFMVEDNAHGATVMARLDDGWCIALDRGSLRCTIYALRPLVCRDYATGGDDCLVERAASGLMPSRPIPLVLVP